jgi:transcriptional regulator with XRE-family HTH domain
MTIPLKDMKDRLLADPEAQAEYDRLGPEFEFAQALVRARSKAGLSQTVVAERMGTTQSAVARIESGKVALRPETIKRYAAAVGHRVELRLIPEKKARGQRIAAPAAAAGNKPHQS